MWLTTGFNAHSFIEFVHFLLFATKDDDSEPPYKTNYVMFWCSILVTHILSALIKRMKLVIFGATGRIGSNLLRSALDKGHEVLAIARHPENIKVKHDNLQQVSIVIFLF